MRSKDISCDELLNPEKTLERLANPEPQKGETEETDGEPPKKKNSLIVKTAVLVGILVIVGGLLLGYMIKHREPTYQQIGTRYIDDPECRMKGAAMKKIFSNYYKIILSVVILIVLVALKENYKTSFDEMSGVRTVVRMLLYTAWGFLLATKTRRDKAKAVEYVAFAVVCVAALNLLIPIWKFQIAFYAFVAGVPGLYFMVFILTGMLGGYIWGPVDKTDRK